MTQPIDIKEQSYSLSENLRRTSLDLKANANIVTNFRCGWWTRIEDAEKDGSKIYIARNEHTELCDLIRWVGTEWSNEFGNGEMTHVKMLSISTIK